MFDYHIMCQVFEKLRNTGVTLTDRLHTILGDCQTSNLGISAEDRKVLIAEVNVVFHLAATVRFDEPLQKAVSINVRATLDLLELAKEMRNLEVSKKSCMRSNLLNTPLMSM